MSNLRHITGSSRAHFWRNAALWLCLGLLALLAVAQVTHYHKDAVDADNCAICVVLQHAAPLEISLAAVVLVALARVAPPVLQPVRIHRAHRSQYIRPPPIG